MSDCTYIVFGESGNFFSKIIKERNSNIKIIHFLGKYYEDYSCADIKVYLDDVSLGYIGHSYSRYENLEINDKLNKSIDNALENIQNVIIMDGVEDGFYSLMLLITKKSLKKNIHCVNLFFEPFNCFGKRRKEIYKNFFKEITHIKKDNYYFSCECLKKYNLTKYGFFSIFNLINKIQYNISINLDKNINLTIENTISNEFDTTNESINKNLPKQYTYVSVIYDDDIVAKTINEPSFYYKTDLEDIWINDKVLVNRNGKDVIGIVIDIEKFYEEDVPFPIDKTKDILKIIEEEQNKEIRYTSYEDIPESEITKYLEKWQVNFLYNTDIIINTDIVELIEQLSDYLQKYGIENDDITETGKITEEIIDVLTDINPDKDMYKYIFVEPNIGYDDKIFCYKSNINGIYLGDTVLIEFGNEQIEGIVRSIGYYSKDKVPYPLEKTKNIIKIIDYNFSKDSCKINYNLFQKDVKVTLKDGKIFTGLFYEIFNEENTIMIGNTIINIKDIKEMKEIEN